MMANQKYTVQLKSILINFIASLVSLRMPQENVGISSTIFLLDILFTFISLNNKVR